MGRSGKPSRGWSMVGHQVTRHSARARERIDKHVGQDLGDPMVEVLDREWRRLAARNRQRGLPRVPYAGPPFGSTGSSSRSRRSRGTACATRPMSGRRLRSPDTDDGSVGVLQPAPARRGLPDRRGLDAGSRRVRAAGHGVDPRRRASRSAPARPPAYDGRTFARDGIVHVAINYRLGVEGFLLPRRRHRQPRPARPDRRARVGAAQHRRVRRAIRTTSPSSGSPAGRVSVIDLLAMPSARGTVRAGDRRERHADGHRLDRRGRQGDQASGPEAGHPADRRRFPGDLGGGCGRAGAATGLQLANPLRSGASAFNLSPFRAVHGTPSLPVPPMQAAATPTGVPLLTGTVQNETIGFLELLGRVDDINPAPAWPCAGS